MEEADFDDLSVIKKYWREVRDTTGVTEEALKHHERIKEMRKTAKKTMQSHLVGRSVTEKERNMPVRRSQRILEGQGRTGRLQESSRGQQEHE